MGGWCRKSQQAVLSLLLLRSRRPPPPAAAAAARVVVFLFVHSRTGLPLHGNEGVFGLIPFVVFPPAHHDNQPRKKGGSKLTSGLAWPTDPLFLQKLGTGCAYHKFIGTAPITSLWVQTNVFTEHLSVRK